MVYDVADDVVLAFVPIDRPELDVWSYDSESNRWTARTPAMVSPPSTWRPSGAYNPRTRTVYLRDLGSGALWYYTSSENRWTVVEQFGELPPSGAVNSRAGQCAWMVYDEAGDRLVLVLGWMDQGSRSWTRVRTETPAFLTGFGQSGGEAVYDVARSRTVVDTGGVLAAFDSSAGTWSTPAAVTDQSLVRQYETLVYDPIGRRILMIGGTARMDGAWPVMDDVQAYDATTGTWRLLVAPTKS
jgi:hypothetical protein